MSYTTEGQPQGLPKGISNFLRENIISEIVAINQYTYHIANSNNPKINYLWHHILADEIRHYSMFTELLRKYDPVQGEVYKEVEDHMKTNPLMEYPITGMAKIEPYDLIMRIRKDIKGELEAIILYERMIDGVRYKDIIQTTREIIKDEKEHFEELTYILGDNNM